MQARLVRDGKLGLFILVGVGIFSVVLLWLKGFRVGTPFTFVIKFPDANGLDVGSPVRFRGVQVGRVQSVQAESGNVNVTVAVDNPNLAMPRQSIIETNQSGFLSNTAIDISPQANVGSDASFSPLNPNCNSSVVICKGSTVDGGSGVNFTQLLRETSGVMRKLNNDEVIANLNKTLKVTADAAQSVKKLSDAATQLVGKVDAPLKQFSLTADAISQAAGNIGRVANNADSLILENKEKLARTLDSISATSNEARTLLAGARPLVSNTKFIDNLQKLSDNAAETAANLRQLSGEINNPSTLAALRETLDSARATFANTQKITADLDELTGDPKFRANVRNLVNGLSGLVSTGSTLIPPTVPTNTPDANTLAAKLKSPIKPINNDKNDSPLLKLKLGGKQADNSNQKLNDPAPSRVQSPAQVSAP